MYVYMHVRVRISIFTQLFSYVCTYICMYICTNFSTNQKLPNCTKEKFNIYLHLILIICVRKENITGTINFRKKQLTLNVFLTLKELYCAP